MGEETGGQRTRRRARNASRAERRHQLAKQLPIMNLDKAFEVVQTRQHRTPLAPVASIDLITRATPQDKYTTVLSQLAERAYELLNRQNPIPSVSRTLSVRSQHVSSRGHAGPSAQPHEDARQNQGAIEGPRQNRGTIEGPR